MENEKISEFPVMEYNGYAVFKAELKYGSFYKALKSWDDPENPKGSFTYARDPHRALGFLLRKEAEELINHQK